MHRIPKELAGTPSVSEHMDQEQAKWKFGRLAVPPRLLQLFSNPFASTESTILMGVGAAQVWLTKNAELSVLSIGVQYNNPAVLVELEKGLWPETVEINCFLSIGTGLRGDIEIPRRVMQNPFDAVKAMKELITHTEAPHRELEERHGGKNRYSRLNVDDGKVGKVDLTEFQMMPFIEEQTLKYLRRQDVRDEIERVAERLAGTSGCSPDHDPDRDAESIAKISAETAKRRPLLKSKSEKDEMRLAIYLLGRCAALGLEQSGSDIDESDSRTPSSKRFAPGMST